MRGDFETIRRQFLAAQQALETAQGNDAVEAMQKVYDQAKELYESHRDHPKNKFARKHQRVEKRF